MAPINLHLNLPTSKWEEKVLQWYADQPCLPLAASTVSFLCSVPVPLAPFDITRTLSDMLLLQAFVFFFSLWNALPLRTTWLFPTLLRNWNCSYVEVPKTHMLKSQPCTSECNHIWRNYHLTSVSKEEAAKGGALIHMTDILIRRERREQMCVHRAVPPGRTQQEASHLQAKERVFREKSNPQIPWSCLSSIPYCEKINFCFLSHSSLVLC